MNKLKILLAAALIPICAAATIPKPGSTGTIAGLAMSEVESAALNTSAVAATEQSLPPTDLAPSMLQSAKTAITPFSLDGAEVITVSPVSLGDATCKAEFNATAVTRKAVSRAAGTVKEGYLFTKDLNYQGTTYNYRITLAKADDSSDDNAYVITNIYGIGTSVNATIDEASGTVTIPCQTIGTSSLGDVKICPVTFLNGRIIYSLNDVVGSIDSSGKITLPGWALLITEGDNAGAGYNIFMSSEWVPANATVTAYDIVNSTDVSYPCLIEQNVSKSLTFYGLSGVTAETLTSRLTPAKTVLIPNSYVYTNPYYGEFYIYPFDTNTGKATAGVNLVGTSADGTITFPAWAIASRQYPSIYVGYKYSNIIVTTDLDITWPEAPALNLDGEGTADNPYVITTVAQFDALAATVAQGTDFNGVHFSLGADLDFSSVASASFQPVGDKDNPFNGVFDGAGHTVMNLTVTGYSFVDLGLFGYLGPDAVVKNLNVNRFTLSSSGTNAGAIAGTCKGTIDNVTVTESSLTGNIELLGGIVGGIIEGQISNTSFSGNLKGNGSVAGIAGQSLTTAFDNCHTRAIITNSGYYSSSCRDAGGIVGAANGSTITGCTSAGIIQDTAGYALSGGIAGRILGESIVKTSVSTMAIQATANSTMGGQSPTNCYQGGLFGFAYESEVHDCLSSSYIFQNSAVAANNAGGIVGYLSVAYSFSSTSGNEMKYLTNFYNCYFSGQVYSASSASHTNIYGSTYHISSWTGELPENLAFHNCFYDNQLSLTSDDEYGRPTSFFTSGALPDGFDANVWTAQAGRYPVISATASQQASELAAAPLLLTDGQKATKVSKNFTVTPTDRISWGISTSDGVVQSTDALEISGSNVTIKDIYSNSVIVANSQDGWGIKLYRLAIVPKWFDGEGTADDPFQLKTADDFIKLDTAVGTYAQSHIGDHFKVMNDIDFTGSAFKGVAYGKGSAYSFGGTLDGNGKTIHNLVVDGITSDDDGTVTTTSIIGLISVLHPLGTIKNLTIADDCSFKGYNYTGSVTGASYGRIENVRNHAPVSGLHSYAGGITGASFTTEYNEVSYEGVIVSCYNSADVTGSYSTYGGIAGYNSGLVQLCQNDGAVTGQSLSTETDGISQNSVGGIAGLNYGTIDRCVNDAIVTGCYSVGGIVGAIYSPGSIKGSVNNGYVNCINQDVRRGGIIGSMTSKKELENNFYDSSINVNGGANNTGATGITGLSSMSATSGAVIEGLETEDYDFGPEQYPVLKQFSDEPAARTLRSIVAYFADGQARTNIQTDVMLSQWSTTSGDTQWSLADGTSFTISGNTLKPIIPDDITVKNDVLTASYNGYVKSIPISIIPLILNGEGTEASPFLIETPADWNTLSEFMMTNKYEYTGEHFRIVNDLDFQNDSIQLLAVNGVKFDGVLDGNGKTVKNYVYANKNSTATRWEGPNRYRGVNIGLIGTVGANGIVKNLTANGKFEAVNSIGGIAGEVYGTLQDCVHDGTIANTSGSNCSGIAHKVYDGGQLINCVNNGSVTSKTTYASGIANTVNEGGVIDGCVNNGAVKSTTSGASGIAYSVAGTIRNSANHGSLSGTGTAAGICNTLAKTGKLEDCYNDADILYGTAGSSVAGIAISTSDQTETDLAEPTSWIKNCYNTGNLSGKATVTGITGNIKKGVLVEDCYNTGNVSAVTTNGAFGFTGAVTSNNADNLIPTRILRCWNAGNVTSATAASQSTSGFCKSIAAGTVVEDCYNLGDVTVSGQPTSSIAICCATGFAGSISGGSISRCWNAGNIYGLTPCNAGLAGYAAGTDVTTISDCFNVGNVTGSSVLASGAAGNANGTAGGLFGYISTGNPVIRNCYNAGDITGDKRVGGIAGGMFRPDAVVENCYSSGKINCEDSWSGTIYTSKAEYSDGQSYFANSKNVYYDAEITTGEQSRDFPGSAKTTAEMTAIDLGDAFYNWNSYPGLKSFAADDTAEPALNAARVSTAMVAVAVGDSYDNINSPLTLISDDGVMWSTEGEGTLEISGDTAIPTKIGNVTITAANADGTVTRSFDVNIRSVWSGVNDIDADGKTVVSTIYVDTAGRIIPAPSDNQPYIVKITYDDGTSVVRKIVARD